MPQDRDPRRFLPLTDLAFNLLVALSDGELHGYALLKELRRRTGRAELRTGTVYAALARLQDDGLIRASDPSESPGSGDSRRKYYSLTLLGVKVAQAEAERLRELLRIADARLSPQRTD